MKSDSTTVIKNMEFLVKELHKEWDRSGASKASVIISLEEVDGINDKLKEMILSILVDTFISKISFPMQPGPEIGSISDA